jgi:hypothetical protein
MMHGPCGVDNLRSSCMKNDKCSKHFPKRYYEETTIDDDGFPNYRRRNNGRTVEKNGILLDNRFVVPYNIGLLVKYQAQMNVDYSCFNYYICCNKLFTLFIATIFLTYYIDIKLM